MTVTNHDSTKFADDGSMLVDVKALMRAIFNMLQCEAVAKFGKIIDRECSFVAASPS
jgi:hypothetical protein